MQLFAVIMHKNDVIIDDRQYYDDQHLAMPIIEHIGNFEE